MTAYDFDGVLFPEMRVPKPTGPFYVITSRIACVSNLQLIQSVVGKEAVIYMQPGEPTGDQDKAGRWKGLICRLGGVTKMYEDSPVHAMLIRQESPETEVEMVP